MLDVFAVHCITFSGTSILPVIARWHRSASSVTLCYWHKLQNSQHRSSSLGHACHDIHSLNNLRSCFADCCCMLGTCARNNSWTCSTLERTTVTRTAHLQRFYCSMPEKKMLPLCPWWLCWSDKTFYQKHRLFTLGSSQASTWPHCLAAEARDVGWNWWNEISSSVPLLKKMRRLFNTVRFNCWEFEWFLLYRYAELNLPCSDTCRCSQRFHELSQLIFFLYTFFPLPLVRSPENVHVMNMMLISLSAPRYFLCFVGTLPTCLAYWMNPVCELIRFNESIS